MTTGERLSRIRRSSAGGGLLLALAIGDFADVRAAQNHQECTFLVTDITKTFHQTGWERDGVPRPKFHFALAVLAPEEFPSAAERHKYFNHRMTVQRRTLTRLYLVERQGEAVLG